LLGWGAGSGRLPHLFLTGLISHLHQHPIAWLPISPSPSWAYRVTQGLHVATGVASVPLLLAKM